MNALIRPIIIGLRCYSIATSLVVLTRHLPKPNWMQTLLYPFSLEFTLKMYSGLFTLVSTYCKPLTRLLF